MRKQDVRLPGNINLKTGVFLAIDHQLAAVFAVKYEAAENVDYALRTMRRSRITPILAVRDPNITPALLKRKFFKRISGIPGSDRPGGPQRSGGGPGAAPRPCCCGRACCPMRKPW